MTTSYLLKVVVFVSALCYMVAALPKHGNNRGLLVSVNGSAVRLTSSNIYTCNYTALTLFSIFIVFHLRLALTAIPLARV